MGQRVPSYMMGDFVCCLGFMAALHKASPEPVESGEPGSHGLLLAVPVRLTGEQLGRVMGESSTVARAAV